MRVIRTALLLCAACMATVVLAGCRSLATYVPPGQRRAIDRAVVEYPANTRLVEVMRDLTGPVDIDFDADGNLFVATGGQHKVEPRIFGIHPDGTRFDIYPVGKRLPFGLLRRGFAMYGPIGGIAVDGGKVYVTHCDADGNGAVTAFDYDGAHSTIVGNLPAQGEHGMTDIAVAPDGRLWFGVGSATNSGVVGLDNHLQGLIKRYPGFCDLPAVPLELRGYRFDSRNPFASIWAPEKAVTAPFQPFNTGNRTSIEEARNDRPNGAVLSVAATGGQPRVVAHGIRWPRGIAFNEFGSAFMTNNGMELRGTRPIKDDPDALLKITPGTWYGWPDYSTSLLPIIDPRFQPPVEMIVDTGYRVVSFLIDHAQSNSPNRLPKPSANLLQGVFPPLSGAARFEFVPNRGPLREWRGQAVVPLAGDRAPFATSGHELVGPTGYRVVRVDVTKDPSRREVLDVIRNTAGGPGSRIDLPAGAVALERPVAVKFAPDGTMYIVDTGQVVMRGGRETLVRGSGRIFRLERIGEASMATTRPAATPAAATMPAR